MLLSLCLQREKNGGWELPLVGLMGASAVLAVVGTIYKPNTNIEVVSRASLSCFPPSAVSQPHGVQVWALEEAAAREEQDK